MLKHRPFFDAATYAAIGLWWAVFRPALRLPAEALRCGCKTRQQANRRLLLPAGAGTWRIPAASTLSVCQYMMQIDRPFIDEADAAPASLGPPFDFVWAVHLPYPTPLWAAAWGTPPPGGLDHHTCACAAQAREGGGGACVAAPVLPDAVAALMHREGSYHLHTPTRGGAGVLTRRPHAHAMTLGLSARAPAFEIV
jgi:hypothetical protein